MTVHVVVSYFRDGSHYPRSGPEAAQREVYWADIAVNAATLAHVGADEPIEFTVFAGDEPTRRTAPVLERAGATVEHLPFAHRPPDDFYVRYLGTLYVLDTMGEMAARVTEGRIADDDVVLFVDPDVVWTRPTAPLVAEVRRGGIVAYELDVPDTLEMCDLTRRQQTRILAGLVDEGPDPDGPAITHFGGEIYGMTGTELATAATVAEALWAGTTAAYEAGAPHFHMEEHVMNGLLWCRGETRGRANAHLERIRTQAAPMGSRDRAHDRLVAWHLPLEKDQGFLTVLDHLADRGELPTAGPDYERWLARRMGIAPVGRRWLLDRVRQVRWKVLRTPLGKGPTYKL